MKELIEFIAKALVDSPDAITVSEDEDADGTILVKLAAAQSDMGRIIGKQGRTAKAIRTILGAASAKEHKRTVLEIVE